MSVAVWADPLDATRTVAAVGAPANAGSTYIYLRVGSGAFTQQQRLTLPNANGTDGFGAALSSGHGGRLLVGAPGVDGQGAGYIYDVLRSQGDPCTSGSQCSTGLCADGVCCNEACDTTCRACSAAAKGTGSDGVCGFVINNKNDGCANPYCLDGKVGPGVCDGACKVSSGTCDNFICATQTTCRITCWSNSQCITTAYCSGSTCLPKKAHGQTCGSAQECVSNVCVGGICCSGPCGTCQACRQTITGQPNGTCANVPNGLDPYEQCVGNSCTAGIVTEQVCNGAGACIGKPKSCAPYPCNAAGTGCNQSCSTDAECGGGTTMYCEALSCAPKKAAGATCVAARECASDNCVEGVCCDTACSGLPRPVRRIGATRPARARRRA